MKYWSKNDRFKKLKWTAAAFVVGGFGFLFLTVSPLLITKRHDYFKFYAPMQKHKGKSFKPRETTGRRGRPHLPRKEMTLSCTSSLFYVLLTYLFLLLKRNISTNNMNKKKERRSNRSKWWYVRKLEREGLSWRFSRRWNSQGADHLSPSLDESFLKTEKKETLPSFLL